MRGFADNETLKDLIHKWPDQAIEYLYDHYYSSLVHVAEQRTHDRKASEDIVQEALTEIWKKAEWLGSQKNLLIVPYLIAIIKNKSITYYYWSKKLGELNSSVYLDDLLSTKISRESEIIQSDQYNALRDIIATLPPRERACIELRFLQEMSIEAVAIQLNISKKGVEKNITSGLKRLRKFKSAMY
jgi:RNA polymerase sigma factor (sigma-70 family)